MNLGGKIFGPAIFDQLQSRWLLSDAEEASALWRMRPHLDAGRLFEYRKNPTAKHGFAYDSGETASYQPKITVS